MSITSSDSGCPLRRAMRNSWSRAWSKRVRLASPVSASDCACLWVCRSKR